MRLVLLGPPGAGKGTQAKILSEKFNLIHISTGNILRQAVEKNLPLGVKEKEFLKKGELVPDDIIVKIVMEEIRGITNSGFVLDGFPRTKRQAEELDATLDNMNLHLDLVIYLETHLQVTTRRLSGRRVCKLCGINYHIENIPPKKVGICDRCGGILSFREDDREETVKKRWEVYQSQIASLIDYYQRKGILRKVSGDLEAPSVYERLSKLFVEEKLL
jgi:adenylate kinase